LPEKVDRFAIWGDDLMRYGELRLENRGWFNLEDVHGHGVLKVPARSGKGRS
jgi:hypothetical protein